MINAILTGIINLIMGLVDLLLMPFDAAIDAFLPDLSDGLSYVAAMFDVAGTYAGYIVNMLGLSSYAITLIVAYWIFKLTAPSVISAVKSAIQWVKALLP